MCVLTRKLSGVLAEKLNRGDEALAALTELADQGDADLRAYYEELGDKLGWHGIVATKLVEWWMGGKPSPERLDHLRGAFERFAKVGRNEDAVKIGCEIVRSKGADAELAKVLEGLAIKTKNLDAIAIAHDLIARELSGPDRARELVRQAETRVEAGAPRPEAMEHGEAGLSSVPPAEAEPLLERLAALAEKPGDVVDLYERQVSRCKAPADRIAALARAAQVAGARDLVDRARGFFDIALSGSPADESLSLLEKAARDADAESKGERMQTTLCEAFASAGQGARDGGRTRGSLLRRAASLAHNSLSNTERAFELLGEALVTHVEPASLDALESLAREVNDLRRAEATLTRALGEVFDGPLVRLLLARRAKLRRHDLDDRPGAAVDLKKLHDLSPGRPERLGRSGPAPHVARRLPRPGGPLRGSDPARQGRGRPRRPRAQGREDVGGAARRPSRGGRCLAAGAASQAQRPRRHAGPRSRQVEHAEEAEHGARASESEPPSSPPSGSAKPPSSVKPAPSAAPPKEDEPAEEAKASDEAEAGASDGSPTDRPAAPPDAEAAAHEEGAQPSAEPTSAEAGAAESGPTAETDGAITKPPPPGMTVDAPEIPAPPSPLASSEDVVFDDDEEMAADDMIMDVEEAAPEKPSTPPVKRSIPPPLPRS